MNFATFTIASAVALIGAFANAEEVARTSEESVIALVAAKGAPQGFASHRELTGLYRTASGESFFVEEQGASLTVELPAGLGTKPLELAAESDGYVFVADDATRVVFERESGRVVGLRLFKPNANVVAARKTTPRGIVLIYDVPHRGIVKVYDIT